MDLGFGDTKVMNALPACSVPVIGQLERHETLSIHNNKVKSCPDE